MAELNLIIQITGNVEYICGEYVGIAYMNFPDGSIDKIAEYLINADSMEDAREKLQAFINDATNDVRGRMNSVKIRSNALPPIVSYDVEEYICRRCGGSEGVEGHFLPQKLICTTCGVALERKGNVACPNCGDDRLYESRVAEATRCEACGSAWSWLTIANEDAQ